MGAREFLYNDKRWVLWLGEANPSDLRQLPKVIERIELVRDFRLKSKSKPTQKIAVTPTRFHVENMPKTNYLVIPEVSSEKRFYIPIGFINPEVLASNLVKISSNATLYDFGVISSAMHMSWMRYTSGKLEGRYRYSIKLVYHNYPWPFDSSKKNKKSVEAKAQKVLNVRAEFSKNCLADLYDPLTMPPKLIKAHQELDKAVDLCYRPQAFTNETARIEFLFDLYNEYTMPLLKKKQNT